jgi:hypothetical protein
MRYFALNTLAGISSRTSAVNVLEDTSAAPRDAAYVASSIFVQVNHSFQIKGPFLDGSNAIANEFYLRFDLYNNNRFAANNWTLYTAAGVNAYRIICSAVNTLQFQYWNSGTAAWVNWGATWAQIGVVRVTYTLKLNPGNSFTLYRNGAEVLATGAAPVNAAASVGIFEFGSMNDLAQTYYSQIMCADYDIRDSHMFSLLPVANGNYADGTGAPADVNEVVLDDGGAINLPAVGNKHTFTKGAIVVPAGLVIASMVVNARTRVGGGVVNHAKIKCRSGAVDANTANLTPDGAYSGRTGEFTTDPNTGTAWAQAGFNAAEFGLEAAA